jgi:hypothetical protein
MEDALHNLLSGCTALESLELTYIYGIGAICISSQTLRSLAFNHYGSKTLQLVIKDAPSLERLLPLYQDCDQGTIEVIRAPKLEVLGLLSKYLSKFQFGTTIFEVEHPSSIPHWHSYAQAYYSCLQLFFSAENDCCQLNNQNSDHQGFGSQLYWA